jgi:hypothetical protein
MCHKKQGQERQFQKKNADRLIENQKLKAILQQNHSLVAGSQEAQAAG